MTDTDKYIYHLEWIEELKRFDDYSDIEIGTIGFYTSIENARKIGQQYYEYYMYMDEIENSNVQYSVKIKKNKLDETYKNNNDKYLHEEHIDLYESKEDEIEAIQRVKDRVSQEKYKRKCESEKQKEIQKQKDIENIKIKIEEEKIKYIDTINILNKDLEALKTDV